MLAMVEGYLLITPSRRGEGRGGADNRVLVDLNWRLQVVAMIFWHNKDCPVVLSSPLWLQLAITGKHSGLGCWEGREDLSSKVQPGGPGARRACVAQWLTEICQGPGRGHFCVSSSPSSLASVDSDWCAHSVSPAQPVVIWWWSSSHVSLSPCLTVSLSHALTVSACTADTSEHA